MINTSKTCFSKANTKAASLGSYGLIVGLVAAVGIGSLLTLGDEVEGVFSDTNSSLLAGDTLSARPSSQNVSQSQPPEPEPEPTCSLGPVTATASPSTDTSDVFTYEAADGAVTWNWRNSSSSYRDTLYLTDLFPDDVLFINTNNEDMNIVVTGGATAFVNDQNDSALRSGFHTIVFCDETTLTRQTIRNKAIFDSMTVGTAIGSTLIDSAVYDPNVHTTVMYDNYNGSSSWQDSLRLEGINSDDVTIIGQSDAETVILYLPNDDTITLDDQSDSSNRHGVGSLIFADRSYTRTQLRNRASDDAMLTGTVRGSTLAETHTYDASVHDTVLIDNNNGSSSWQDSLVFSTLNADDVSFQLLSDQETLRISLGDGETLTVDDQTDTSNRHGVGSIRFADGTTLNRSQIRSKIAADAMVSGSVIGSSGIESYVYDSTLHDSVSIDNYNGSSSWQDSLTFVDVNSTDVTFATLSDLETVRITLSDNETVTLDDQSDTSNRHGVGSIQFADGVTLTRTGIKNRAIADAMGSSLVRGTSGIESFVYDVNTHGTVTLDNYNGSSSWQDTLRINVNEADATFSTRNDRETLTITLSSGVITVDDQFDTSNRHGMGSIVFNDTTLNRSTITRKANDDDMLTSYVWGKSGAESYSYTTTEHGNVTIDNYQGSSSWSDTLYITDQDPGDVTFAYVSGDNLRITMSDNDILTVVDQGENDSREAMDRIIFQDGTTLNRSGIDAKEAADSP